MLTGRLMPTGRRSLLLVGAAAAALTVTSARAQTAFTGFAFPATGGSSSRTMPARLADMKNVLDYGADPTGGVDSATAIQSAINAAAGAGPGSKNGSTVFFPPGVYLVGTTLANTTSGSVVVLRGSGSSCTQLKGNSLNAYVVDQLVQTAATNNTTAAGNNVLHFASVPATVKAGMTVSDEGNSNIPANTTVQSTTATTVTISNNVTGGGIGNGDTIDFITPGQIGAIYDLDINNPSSNSSSGALRLHNSNGVVISSCLFEGFNGVDCSVDSFNLVIDGCVCTGSSNNGTGVWGAAGLYGCVATGFNIGFNFTGSGFVSSNCRVESCTIGVSLGGANFNGSSHIGEGVIIGMTTENNDTHVHFTSSGVSNVAIIGCLFTNNTTMHYGIRIEAASQCSVIATTVTGSAITASIDISGVAAASPWGPAVSFESVAVGGPSNWTMNTNAPSQFSFRNCDNPLNAMPFSKLPSSPVEGMEFILNDCLAANCGDGSCNTWATTVTGGTGALHRKVYYNGSNWTVAAK